MDVAAEFKKKKMNGKPEGFANENSSTGLDPSRQCL